MAEIHDRAQVDCPLEQAADLLTVLFARRGALAGEGAVMTIQVPIVDVAVARGIEVNFSPHPEHSHYRKLNVAWAPSGGGPYPTFEGIVSFERAGQSQTSIVLDGTYEPPGGVVGKAFDAVVGHRIAAAAVRALLEALKRELEAAYRDERERAANAARPNYLPTYE
jgi:hypothetical protein